MTTCIPDAFKVLIYLFCGYRFHMMPISPKTYQITHKDYSSVAIRI